ncbi:MAG: FtsX-like permease family protein, partial [Butyrivibrio sp.]|nr:FtsX-like permease family protein [Butyrivibrio sp.]
SNSYCSLNGEQLMLMIYGDGKYIPDILEGRAPRYDNEIVVTEIAAESLELEIGDRVTVGRRDKKVEYMITGFNQCMNDVGMNFSMTAPAAEKLYEELPNLFLGYILEDKAQGENVEEALNKKYGNLLEAGYEENPMDPMIEMGIYAIVAVVYFFSAVFALVVVQMVCSKAFLKERQDIGIYKAMGFTAGTLRLQFSFRFMFVAAVGAVFGCGAALLFGKNMLGMILRQVGISSLEVGVTLSAIFVPAVVICVYFFFFTLFSSRKIKRVEVKELITE